MDSINLDGDWNIQLQTGRKHTYWNSQHPIVKGRLPGSLTTNKIGNEISLKTPWMGFTGRGGFRKDRKFAPYRKENNFKIPFWLQPIKYYRGKAFYQRKIKIPEEWRGLRIILFMERVHWGSKVWVDKTLIGSCESLATPHKYELPQSMLPGEHILTICVDNNHLYRVGIDAHSVTDHTQTNWNGIIGKIELQATPRIWSEDIQIYPVIETKQVIIKGIVCGDINEIEKNSNCHIQCVVSNQNQQRFETEIHVNINKPKNPFEIMIKMEKPIEFWDEFSPNLYNLEIKLSSEYGPQNTTIPFGFRKFSTQGNQ